jgi:hypothetical protein
MILVTTMKNILYADEIDFEWMGYRGEPTNEPVVCVHFDCGACGEQHAKFAELVKCFKEQQAAREIVAVVVA